jgi:glycosyltransferase involved in cell wall biosynthesis
MKILIPAHSVFAFTSGTPMRGLILKLITLRKNDLFHIILTKTSKKSGNTNFLENLTAHQNVSIRFENQSPKTQNLKKLLGLKSNDYPSEFDFYLSPGIPEHFSKNQQPSLSIIADLSSINLPGQSSLKWHGNRIFKNTLNWALTSNTKIAAISDFTRKELEAYCTSQTQKYFTLHNGIEDFWFDNHFEDNEISAKLKNESYWIWWGYISNRKNITSLLTAYLAAKKKAASLPKIVFIGQHASDQQGCIDLINKHPDYFQRFDFQPNYALKTIVKNSQGLVFPSIYEGFGLPVIEAFSQGVPVLHSNVTSLPEVGNGQGIEVDPNSIDSIVDGLIQLHQSPNSAEQVAARQNWASSFTYQRAALQLSAMIDELTGN